MSVACQEKILIVDDEPLNLTVYEKIFAEAGYSVSTVDHSKDILPAIEKSHPDLILLDIILDTESGIDVLSRIRQNARFQNLFVVLMSGKLKSSDDQARGLELGADGYLLKPFEKRELLARIESFLRHKRTMDSLRQSEERFRRIIDRNPDAMIIVDDDGKIEFSNPAAEKLFNLSTEELLNRNFGYPMIEDEYAEISVYGPQQAEKIGEMRAIDIEWKGGNSFLTSIRDVSDRKRTEEALRENEESLRATLKSMGDGVIAANPQGVVTRLNPAAERITGWPGADALGRKLSEVFVLTDRESGRNISDAIPELIRSGQDPGITEHSFLTNRHGRQMPIFVSVAPIHDIHDYLIGIVIVFRDESREHKIRTALEESEVRFRSLFEQAGDGLFVHDEEGRIIDVNRMFCVLFGYEREELLSMNVREMIVGHEAVADLWNPDRGGRETHEAVRFEAQFARKTGETVDGEVSFSMISVNGIALYYSIFRDISQRKHAEKMIRYTEKKFRSLIEHAPDGILLVDPDTRLEYVSPQAAEILGYSETELIGRALVDFLSSEDRQLFFEEGYNPAVDKAGTISSVEHRFARKNGTLVWVESTFTDFPLDANIRHVIINFRDISERRQMRLELKKDLDEKKVLLRELYHRTKNNLQLISAIINLRKRTISEEWVKNLLDEIDSRIMSIALVHQKLYETRDLSHLNIREYLESLVQLFERSYFPEDKEIKIHFDSQDIRILIDIAVPLGQMLSELISNSIKHAFANRKTGRIEIIVTNESEGIVVCYADDGAGVPADFDIKKGANLGLETVWRLVEEQLRGSISINQRSGLGFRIVFDQNSFKARV